MMISLLDGIKLCIGKVRLLEVKIQIHLELRLFTDLPLLHAAALPTDLTLSFIEVACLPGTGIAEFLVELVQVGFRLLVY